MKTRLLLALCLMLMVSFQVYAQINVQKGKPAKTAAQMAENSDKKLSYSYCGEMSGDGIGYRNSGYEERFYIHIPARQWKGCKITAVEIGLAFEVGKDSYVFISKDVEKEPDVKQYYQCDTIPPREYVDDVIEAIGWKKVPLDKAYTIDSDDDLYIGWYTIQGEKAPCAIDGENPVADGCYASVREVGKEEWKDMKLKHNPLIRVTIEGDNIPQSHLRTISYSADQLYYKPGETVYVETIIKNEGTLPVSSFDITYQLSQNEPVTQQITDVTLQPMEMYNFLVETPINEEGKGNLKLTLSNLNGKPDDFPETATTLINSFGCLAKGLQKTVVVEEMVSTAEAKCPEATKIIEEAIDKCDRKDNVIWIQNHGLAKDEYTIKGFSQYKYLFPDDPFTPAVTIDHRVALPGALMPDGEDGTTQTTCEFFLTDENFGNHLENCLNEENVYFSLGVECETIYDELLDQDVLKIKMEAKPALEGLFPAITDPGIVLMLVENNIVGTQAGVEGEYIHNGIIRAFINNQYPSAPYLGDGVKIPAEGLYGEATYAIPDKSWNLDNMNLIFYITDANVTTRNAAMCPVKKIPDGLKQETSDNSFTVTCKDGTLNINGEFDNARIFAISGQMLMDTNEASINVSGLDKGIYCVLIQKGNHCVSKKFIIK